MTTINDHAENPFVRYLLGLSDSQERGVLAVLRRGLSEPPGQDLSMYPYVARFVPENLRGRKAEKIYYLVAALYAYHPMNTVAGNFGNHMSAAAGETNRDATERRFVALLKSHPDDLADYLRQAVSFVKSKDIPVNWEILFNDLQQWDQPERSVQRRWANAFWGSAVDVNPAPEPSTNHS